MKTYVLDANAITRFLTQGAGWEKVRELVSRSGRGEAKLAVSVINRGEALYILARKTDFESASHDLRVLGEIVEAVPVSEERSINAASLTFRYKLGLGDSYAASLALERNATLVTADPEFARLGKQLKILSLPRHSA